MLIDMANVVLIFPSQRVVSCRAYSFGPSIGRGSDLINNIFKDMGLFISRLTYTIDANKKLRVAFIYSSPINYKLHDPSINETTNKENDT